VHSVPVPPASASPDLVVKTYLAAVIARDLDTVRAISSPEYFEVDRNAPDSPICNWISIKDISVSTPVPDTYEPGGYKDVNRVLVEFVVQQREEITWENGRVVWGYLLGRNSVAERWRIISAGLG
jgi:hypothetical protein